MGALSMPVSQGDQMDLHSNMRELSCYELLFRNLAYPILNDMKKWLSLHAHSSTLCPSGNPSVCSSECKTSECEALISDTVTASCSAASVAANQVAGQSCQE